MAALGFGMVVLGSALWLVTLLLPWRPWRVTETLDAGPNPAPMRLDDVTVLIPARNEAKHIAGTLAAVQSQGKGVRCVVVDDQSEDDTGGQVAARMVQFPELNMLAGAAVPQGWTGKLWALQQGLQVIQTPWVLLLDADIELAPGILPAALCKCRADSIGFLSLMAHLHMTSFWERLLLPSFVFFFKLLYPFSLSNAGHRWVAAAAGGFILCRREDLQTIDAFKSLRGEVIDDCALARRMRCAGVRTWVGLSHSLLSRRSAARLAEIWHMVARTAYIQLRHSVLLLVAASILLAAAFFAPLAGMLSGDSTLVIAGGSGFLAMLTVYQPTLVYYGQGRYWALLLPLIGALYLAMTWTSAVRYWRGVATHWKGRRYSRSSL